MRNHYPAILAKEIGKRFAAQLFIAIFLAGSATTLGCQSPGGPGIETSSVDAAPAQDAGRADHDISVSSPSAEGVGGVTVGEQRLLVLLIDNADEPPRVSAQTARKVIDDVANWLETASYGRMTLNSTVVGWIALSGAGVADEQKIYLAAQALGVDFADYDRLLYLFSGGEVVGGGSTPGKIDLSFGQGATEKILHLSRAAVGQFDDTEEVRHVIIHELGHGFGLPHADSISSITGESTKYGDFVDSMGQGYGHYNADYKQLLGWLKTDEITTVTQSGTYQLKSLESGQGVRGLRIIQKTMEIGELAGEHYYMLETRNTTGLAKDLPHNTAGGVLIHLVRPEGSQSPYERKAFAIDATPETPSHDSADFALMPGRTFNDAEHGIFITLSALSENGAQLVINLGDAAIGSDPQIESISAELQGTGPYQANFSLQVSDPAQPLAVFWNHSVTGEGRDGEFYSSGSHSNGSSTSHTFPDDTPRRIFSLVSDMRGRQTWGWVDLFGYENSAPKIEALTAVGEALIGFGFSAVVNDSELVSYRWDFGDGTTSPLPRPHHLYQKPGSYSVTLTVTDHELVTVEKLVVESYPKENQAPIANAGPDQTVAPGQKVKLVGSMSQDPDNYPSALSYQWIPPTHLILSESVEDARWFIEFTAPDLPGEYEFTLNISDGNLNDTDTVILTVE